MLVKDLDTEKTKSDNLKKDLDTEKNKSNDL